MTVTNNNPGLERLHVWINSKHFTTLNLRDNETRSLDLVAAMTEKANTISLVGAGELGASASVAVVDTPPAAAGKKGGVGATAAAPAQGSSPATMRSGDRWRKRPKKIATSMRRRPRARRFRSISTAP